VVKKYKVGQRLSKIDGTEGGGYLLKLAVRADQYLYLGDYIEDSDQTNVLNTKSVQIARFLFRVTITTAAFFPEVLTNGS
jgi:hypothetical protein